MDGIPSQLTPRHWSAATAVIDDAGVRFTSAVAPSPSTEECLPGSRHPAIAGQTSEAVVAQS